MERTIQHLTGIEINHNQEQLDHVLFKIKDTFDFLHKISKPTIVDFIQGFSDNESKHNQKTHETTALTYRIYPQLVNTWIKQFQIWTMVFIHFHSFTLFHMSTKQNTQVLDHGIHSFSFIPLFHISTEQNKP